MAISIAWSQIEPQPAIFDWSIIDEHLSKAIEKGIKVTISITNGPDAPLWLEDEGASFFEYSSPSTGAKQRIPLPWDAVYLMRYTEMIQALGSRYDNHPALRLIRMTNSTSNGYEMDFLLSDEDKQAFIGAGYSAENFVASWKQIIDAFAQAFIKTPLDLEIRPVLGNSDIAYEISQYGLDNVNQGFGVFAAWWSHHNATQVYPEMYDLMKQIAERSFSTVQIAGSVTEYDITQPLSETKLLQALELAATSSINYIEMPKTVLYNPDLMQRLSELQKTNRTRELAH